MLFIRQSLRRLVGVVGNNPSHYSTRNYSNPCLFARDHLVQSRQQCSSRSFFSVATTCKLPWTVLSLSRRFLASETVSSRQGLETIDSKKIKLKLNERNLDKVNEDWEEEGVICPHCGTGFTNNDALQNHIDKTAVKQGGCKELRRIKNREDVLAGIKPHVCDECGFGFKIKSQLDRHKHIHSNKKQFACTQCGKMFKTKGGLNTHIQESHSGQSFTCPKCNKLFSKKSNMMTHFETICSSAEKEFKCGQCGKKFSLKWNLTEHIKLVHENLDPEKQLFKCEVCYCTFANKSSLRLHVRTVHETARPYKCDDCDATFKSSLQLNNHRIAKHTFEWNIYCDLCKKGFLSASYLKKHMMTRHPTEYQENLEKEMPAVCPKCNKRFPSEDQVEIHLKKMHSGL